MLRNFVKNLSVKNLRSLVKNNSLPSSFSNQRCIAPLSTTELALKNEKLKDVASTITGQIKLTERLVLFSKEIKKAVSDLLRRVKITFVLHDGKRLETEAKVGDSLLDVVVNNDLNIEGYGACEGTLTCSTCHVVLKPDDYARLPEEPCDEERDMLDLAYGLTDTSRLGCQITLTKDLDGLEIQVPETINDARS